ncbi:hypothetical protein [Streptomyces sp. NPDC002490]|uniref:hypothetical protein n=1 Tax=Streptomyces sp. NPDC002490 TaxID=3154416 RepID=UPI00332ACCE1
MLEGSGSVYRMVEVATESPLSEGRELKLARRRFVTWVMEAARAEPLDSTGVPHSEMYGILCDFFTRAIVFPGFGSPFGTEKGDTSLHTSTPSRALSPLLLEYLTYHGLDLREMEAGHTTTPLDEELSGDPLRRSQYQTAVVNTRMRCPPPGPGRARGRGGRPDRRAGSRSGHRYEVIELDGRASGARSSRTAGTRV